MFWRLTFPTTQDQAPFFEAPLEPYALSVSWREDEALDVWYVEAIFSERPDLKHLKTLLAIAAELLEVATPELTVEELPDTDWLQATWQNFPPRTVGKFFIYGTHNQTNVPPDLIGLEINAATAFGSGEHETTTGCLLTLEELAKKHSIQNALDMGCGSGILAIATAKLWNRPVWAADNDPEAVRVTLQNAELNQCPHLINAMVSEGFTNPKLKEQAPFDLIVANILSKPLCLMAKDAAKNLSQDGFVILSGLLDWQEEEVLSAYQAVGLTLKDKKTLNHWTTLMLG